MKTVNDVLFNTSLLTMDEAKRIIDSYTVMFNAIRIEARIDDRPEKERLVNIESILEQHNEQHKRILKRLL